MNHMVVERIMEVLVGLLFEGIWRWSRLDHDIKDKYYSMRYWLKQLGPDK